MLRLCLLVLIAVPVGRLAVVVPAWIDGAPLAYPGQYLGRLYFGLNQVSLLTVAMLELGAKDTARPGWQRVLPWPLLAVSFVALVLYARLP